MTFGTGSDGPAIDPFAPRRLVREFVVKCQVAGRETIEWRFLFAAFPTLPGPQFDQVLDPSFGRFSL